MSIYNGNPIANQVAEFIHGEQQYNSVEIEKAGNSYAFLDSVLTLRIIQHLKNDREYTGRGSAVTSDAKLSSNELRNAFKISLGGASSDQDDVKRIRLRFPEEWEILTEASKSLNRGESEDFIIEMIKYKAAIGKSRWINVPAKDRSEDPFVQAQFKYNFSFLDALLTPMVEEKVRAEGRFKDREDLVNMMVTNTVRRLTNVMLAMHTVGLNDQGEGADLKMRYPDELNMVYRASQMRNAEKTDEEILEALKPQNPLDWV